MNVSLLTILAIVYLVIAIISIIYFILITFERPDILFQEEFGKLSEEPFVSIIVPTYNEENNILTCLHSLKMLDYSNYEIILSDGGSNDRTVELAKPYVDKGLVEETLPKVGLEKIMVATLQVKLQKEKYYSLQMQTPFIGVIPLRKQLVFFCKRMLGYCR